MPELRRPLPRSDRQRMAGLLHDTWMQTLALANGLAWLRDEVLCGDRVELNLDHRRKCLHDIEELLNEMAVVAGEMGRDDS